MTIARRVFLLGPLLALAALAPLSFAQQPASGELRAARALEAARKAGPGELYAFLKPFPKGADLHMHLSGAIYAETFIAEAAQQGVCVTGVAEAKPPAPVGQDAVSFVKPDGDGNCPKGAVAAANALKDQALYDNLVDSFSMRAFVPTQGITGHDQFFATFGRFGGMKDERGAWLDEVASRAAAQNEQYLEIMDTPPFSHARAIALKMGWPASAENSISREQLAALRDQLLAGGLREEVPLDIAQYKQELADQQQRNHCAARDIVNAPCDVKIHFLYQILRQNPPAQVFAQTLLGFEAATADPEDIVGINFVQPEDAFLAMRDYTLQMQMLDYLHSVYPKVKISLHAGELAPGVVPPDGLSFHIRQAIDLGHASRIGHGVDALYEDNPAALRQQMAAQHIMVEINLTSNDGILGIKGDAHPLHAYMAAHVPWALSTDDEGVNRSDLTREYVKGVEEQALTYADLKRSARTSLEHAFLHGASLWAAPDDFTRRNAACAAPITARSTPSKACTDFLTANEKAAEQWELERRLAAFEANLP